MKLAEVLQQIDAKAAEVSGLFDKSDEAGGDMSAEDIVKVKDLNKEIEGLEHEAKDLQEREGIRTANERRVREAKTPAPGQRPQFPGGEGGNGERRQPAIKSYGAHFIESPEFKDWLKTIAPHGDISTKKQFTSPSIPLPGLGAKALITGASDTSGGAMVFNDVQAGIVMPGRRPLTVRDIITVGTTDSDTVEYVRMVTETNNAAPVAEATASSGSSGTKPESAMTLEKVTAAVKTIAHWIPATTRAIADAGQLRTLIDAFLEFGLNEELEDQIIAGDGTGENFTGILNTTGTQTQAWDTNLLTTTRRARTKVRVVGRATASAYLLHPNDWEDIDLLQDNEARYYFGGPSVLGNPRLWGLPVVESEGVTEGVGVVGDFRQAVLWDRQQVNIQVSNSHSDFFIRNLVAILAELRAAFGVLRPAAFVEMDLVA
jgi:HK97 family phage major capsid protein